MSQGSFTKLFSSITESTVWGESHATRIVWITMLAMADRNGLVSASVPGLANRARVTLEECEHALMRFSEPDRYSRTPDNDGRRIEPAEGGWRLLNHAKYRAMRDEDNRREYMRDYMAERRKRDKLTVNSVSHSKPQLSHAEAEADKPKTSRASRSDRGGLNGAFTAFWDAYPRKKSKGKAEKAWLKIKPDEQLSTAIVSAVERAKTSADWQRDGGQFIPYPATWLNAKGWEDADASSPAIRTDL